jgi:hypothetical protein
MMSLGLLQLKLLLHPADEHPMTSNRSPRRLSRHPLMGKKDDELRAYSHGLQSFNIIGPVGCTRCIEEIIIKLISQVVYSSSVQ